jgi:hypothetical protein
MILHEERASVGQRMLWLVGRYRGERGQLNYPLLLRLRGPLDLDALQRALDQLAARHEALRTTFARRRGLLTQLVHAPGPVPVTRIALAPESPARQLEAIRQELSTSIDPVRSPVRVTLWRLDDHHHVLGLNAHHLVTDAWSCRILTEELLHLLGGAAELPRVPWQYRHFVRWQHRSSTAAQLRTAGEYWRRQLDGVSPPELSGGPGGTPAGAPPAGGGAPAGGTISLDIPDPAAGRVREIAREGRSTPFAVLLAIYYLTLHEQCGQLDLCVAAPFANRLRPETAGTVGLFANLVMLRTRLTSGIGFAEVLRRTRGTVTQAIAHQEFPYYQLPLAGAQGRVDRLDDVVFQMLPPLPPPVRLADLEVEVVPPELETRFDLELAVVPHRGGYRVRLQYARQRISDRVADQLAGRYRAIAGQVTTEPFAPAC